MGREHNRTRGLWQDHAGLKAGVAERDFFSAFQEHFRDSDFEVIRRPKDFKNLYVSVELADEVKQAIYLPGKPILKHGVFPDYAIKNKKTDKTIYIEVKRQDGWVEGKQRADGRGNAHERSCKFHTPGLIKALRERGGIEEPALPFWVVFLGDITRDPCRVREIVFWYGELTAHYFFWRDRTNPKSLFDHFEKKIKPLLINQSS